MIEISNTEVTGWEHAIRGMRNPMNSWIKSDSFYDGEFKVGDKDFDLMKRLVRSGTDHSKFMRMITVYCDINAPRYLWTEFDTYKVGTVRNSCSTMHKIHSKEFDIDDFSHEHLSRFGLQSLNSTISVLNDYRAEYLESQNKADWWQMIQLLPQSYNQKSTVMFNYQVLRNMYHSRKMHKLDEWREFCKWIESLPYSELITEVE